MPVWARFVQEMLEQSVVYSNGSVVYAGGILFAPCSAISAAYSANGSLSMSAFSLIFASIPSVGFMKADNASPFLSLRECHGVETVSDEPDGNPTRFSTALASLDSGFRRSDGCRNQNAFALLADALLPK